MSAAGTDSGVDCGAFSHAVFAGAAFDSFALDAVVAAGRAGAALVADVVVAAAAAAAISPRQRCC